MKQMSHEKTQPLQNFVFLPLQLSSEHDNALAVSEVYSCLIWGSIVTKCYRNKFDI